MRAEGDLLRRRPHRAGADGERRLRPARRAAVEPGDQPDRRALRDRGLHARGLRRHDHARRPQRQGPARGRQRRRAVRADRAAAGRDHARAVRRPQRQGRRDRHRRQLRRRSAPRPIRTRCGSPTRPAASTAARAPRTSRRSTTAPAPRWTTRASIPPIRRSPTARAWTVPTATTTTRSSGSRAPAASCRTSSTLMRQWLDTGVKPTRDACFMAGGVEGDLTCNGTWRHYGSPRIAAGGPLSSDVVKCRLKPLARADYAVELQRRAVGDARRRRSRPASATTSRSGGRAAAAEGALADVRRRAGRPRARRRAGGGGVRHRAGRRHGARRRCR